MERKKILICDDEVGIRESLNLILSDAYDLSFCNNGQECMDLLDSGKNYDLLLLDIKMPKVNGLDTLKNIKSKHPNQKTITITGYTCSETAQETLNTGSLDYIVKPFSSKDILESVKKNIE